MHCFGKPIIDLQHVKSFQRRIHTLNFQSESKRNIFKGKSFRELGYTGQMAKVSQVKAILLGKNEIG